MNESNSQSTPAEQAKIVNDIIEALSPEAKIIVNGAPRFPETKDNYGYYYMQLSMFMEKGRMTKGTDEETLKLINKYTTILGLALIKNGAPRNGIIAACKALGLI